MYRFLFHSLCCLLISYTSIAVPPKKIYSITRQNLPASYYHEQVNEWKAELDKNQQNTTAWLNYLMAHKVLFQKGKLTQTQLDQVCINLQQAIPNTFEAYFAQYTSTNNAQLLQQAYQLAPFRTEIYPDLLRHYEQVQDYSKMKVLTKQWLDSGDYSSGLLQWNYNALIGLDDNAIILTEGENHTHPLWLLQYGKNIRPDVQVYNLELLTDPAYRQIIFNKLGIPALNTSEKPAIVEHFFNHLAQKKLYVGISLSKGIVQQHEEELYIIGLAFRYSTQSFDNINALINNYEHKFLLDYIQQPLNHDVSQDIVNNNNLSYLPAFLILHDYYKEQNNWQKADAIKQLSFKIASAANKETQLKQYLNKNFEASSSKPLVTIPYKKIEEAFTPMDYHVNLYAGITEVTNAEYELFLSDLMKRKEFDQLQACKIYKTDWRSFLPDEHKNLDESILYTHGKPDNPNAPIQNISYEAAVAYCEWLSDVYNSIEHKKKRFKRVRFRLPTATEWELAASTLSPNSKQYTFDEAPNYLYPWLGPFYKNKLGCFLGNFDVSNAEPCDDCDTRDHPARDGGFFPVKVKTYFPNNYGMFNTSGNVAEMIQEKGKAKGGSWFHDPLDCSITVTQNYQEPQPYIGFRIFMEVLEEKTNDRTRKGQIGPPNTVHLNGNLYIDKTEITNVDWMEFVYWTNLNEPENSDFVTIDSTVWDSSKYAGMRKFYHTHPQYMNYPLVGVSYEQAQAYCQWRTDRVMEAMVLNSPNQVKRFGTIQYRLPSETEWEYAAAGGLNKQEYPYGLESLKNTKGMLNANLLGSPQEDASLMSIMAPSRSYLPNAKGIYNMIGNVAEMVTEKGVVKGGSWNTKPALSKIKQRTKIEKPSSTVGFRCICETNL